jgi:RNA polymerase primary sigma factor
MSNIERSLEYYFRDVDSTQLLGNGEKDAFAKLEMLKQNVMDLTGDYPAIYPNMKIDKRRKRSKKIAGKEIIDYDCMRYVSDGLERICSRGKADKDPLYGALLGYDLNMRSIRSLHKKVKKAYLSAEAQKAMIVEANQRMVIKIAATYFWQAEGKLTPNDLIQEGNIGLIKAVEKFNYKLGIKFATYAKFWIHNYIMKAIYEGDDNVNFGHHIAVDRKKFLDAKAEIEKRGVTANEQNISEAAGISLKTAKALFMSGNALSLNHRISEGPELKDFKLEDTKGIEDGTIGKIFAGQMKARVEEALQVLNVREREILEATFGLNGYQGRMMSPGEISGLFNVSKQAANKTKLNALAKLASSKHAPMLRELLMDS